MVDKSMMDELPMLNGLPILMVGLIAYVGALSLYGYVLMGVDKSRSRKGRGARRISERHLMLVAAACGSPGIWLGMRVFRHKTKHPKFVYGVPVIFLLQLAALWWFLR